MTTDDETPPGLRRLLDAVPEPTVRPVDVPAILAAAAEAQVRAARFWRRTAAATAALAAGLLIFTLARPAPPAADPGIEDLKARLARLEAAAPDPATHEAKLKELRDLVLTLADDVNERDEKTRAAVVAVIRQMQAFDAASAARWADAERTHAALYALSQGTRKEGLNP